MAEQEAFAGTRPITWPRAAIGAAVFFGLMVVLVIVIPNQFVTSDPLQFTKIITIAYVVVLFAVVAWTIAAWQDRGLSPSLPVSQSVSAFGRPMREGPGFASLAEKVSPTPQQQPNRAKGAVVESGEDASSFGRPVKKRSQ